MTPTPPTPPKARPYITIISDRHPKQKAHLNLGQAKNAVAYSWGGGKNLHEVIDGVFTGRKKYVHRLRGGEIWELVGDEWNLLFDVPVASYTHELPWRKDEFQFFVDPDDVID